MDGWYTCAGAVCEVCKFLLSTYNQPQPHGRSLSSTPLLQLLNRLEINNQPVWGLTQEERELVKIAREKVNSC